MNILLIGDIVGQAGCEHVREVLPELKKYYQIDITVANGENSAEGNGISSKSAKFLFDSGIDVITGGNHTLSRRDVYPMLEEKNGMIRPANFHPDAPGEGFYLYDNGKYRLWVINLQGQFTLQTYENPFTCIDRILPELRAMSPNIIIDFHAEATSEKLCMGYYLDGLVSAVVGTHTHVPTADSRVLPKGTGYLTDLGMCGGLHSSLGVKIESAIYRMKTGLPARFENETEDIYLCGAVLDIDEKTGCCRNIEGLTMV